MNQRLTNNATYSIILVMFALVLAGMGGCAEIISSTPQYSAYDITVNGMGTEADAPCYPVFPGKANTLVLRMKPVALPRDGVIAELVRILPNGLSDTTTANLTANQPEAVFDLGAFAAPAEYDFEHGVVYRRGYRFSLTVAAMKAGEEPQVIDFYQGPARQAGTEALWIGDQARYVYNSDQSGESLTVIEALPLVWRFRQDPKDEGMSAGWAKTVATADWPEIRTSDSWTKQAAGKDYHGVAWYAVEFRLSEQAQSRLAELSGGNRVSALRFGAVDGNAEIFLDGVLIGRQMRPVGEMWFRPFVVPLSEDFSPSLLHRLVVRVRKEAHVAGIWKPVQLVAMDRALAVKLNPDRDVYVPGASWTMTPQDQGRQMDPPFELFLEPEVLSHPDEVQVRFGQREGLGLDPVSGTLLVTRASDNRPLLTRDVTIGEAPSIERLDVSSFDQGDYRIELQPAVAGTSRREGPAIVYHRSARDPLDVQVSPLTPWMLKRDPAREEMTVSNFKEAVARWGGDVDAGEWNISETLRGMGDVWAKPLVLRPMLEGYYAVFVRMVDDTFPGAYLRAGKDNVVRELYMHNSVGSQESTDHFVAATDMTGGELAIFQSGIAGQGIASLRLVPVTAESVVILDKISRPPTPLGGINDYLDSFNVGSRLAADQWEFQVKTHAELGMRDLHWAIGRSGLSYDSKLPTSTRYWSVPLTASILEEYPYYGIWQYMVNQYCPLSEVEKYKDKYGIRIQPWLAMNRNYGSAFGGVFASRWFMDNPQWHEWRKYDAGPGGTEQICYFFPEVRKERVDILCELAERPSDGLLVDGSRQPPMLGYHPEMVAAYIKTTGIDPRLIDASAGKDYEDWIRWRAGFFTQTLRELQERLTAIRQRTGKPIPVIVRIPSAGLLYSMAQGFDVESWFRERLLDRLELEPLEDFGGRGSHDVRPYTELGRRYSIPIWAGINCNTMRNPTAVMKRTLGLHEADVDGLYFYESNVMSGIGPLRWVIPLLGDRQRLAEFLRASNVEACYPVKATDCCSGFDNHSRFDGPGTCDVYGRRNIDL